MIAVHIDVLALGSASCKVLPDGHGAIKTWRASYWKVKGGWNTMLHVVSVDDKIMVEMHLSSRSCHDGPKGRVSIAAIGETFEGIPFLMDRAYEGDETRALAVANGLNPLFH